MRSCSRALLFLFLTIAPHSIHAQGCTACRDATAGSAPRVREGLRRGILVLGGAAGSLCIAVFFVARRIEQEREEAGEPGRKPGSVPASNPDPAAGKQRDGRRGIRLPAAR